MTLYYPLNRERRALLSPKLEFAYFKVGKGRATVAGIWDEDEKIFIYGISLCHPEDRFSTKIGKFGDKTRNIKGAVQRLFNHFSVGSGVYAGSLPCPVRQDRHGAFERAIKFLVDNPTILVPSWAREAKVKWVRTPKVKG